MNTIIINSFIVMLIIYFTMIIGCDIGGVVRDMVTGLPIVDAITTLKELALLNYTVIFISKCKKASVEGITLWLKENDLSEFPIYFCEEWSDKVKIARDEKVDVMIDDKIQVLKTFSNSTVMKIWFCADKKKVDGLKKYEPNVFKQMTIASLWQDIKNLIIANSLS